MERAAPLSPRPVGWGFGALALVLIFAHGGASESTERTAARHPSPPPARTATRSEPAGSPSGTARITCDPNGPGALLTPGVYAHRDGVHFEVTNPSNGPLLFYGGGTRRDLIPRGQTIDEV